MKCLSVSGLPEPEFRFRFVFRPEIFVPVVPYCLDQLQSSSEMVKTLQEYLEKLVFNTFPEKKIQIYPDDKPWFTEKLRNLKRERQRIYTKSGKNEKYLNCQKQFDELIRVEISKYKEKGGVKVGVLMLA